MLKSDLNARNTIDTLTVPVILYSYGVIDWKLDEIQDLDRMTRKQLCMNQMLAKKADVDRIYLPCQEGGRSLMNLEKEYKVTMIGLQTYMTNKDDVQIQAVLRHQNSKALHPVPKEAEKYLTEAGTTDDMTNNHGKTATWKAKQLKLKYKEDFKKMVRDKWKEKAMHGKFPNYLDKDHVDVEARTLMFLCSGRGGRLHFTVSILAILKIYLVLYSFLANSTSNYFISAFQLAWHVILQLKSNAYHFLIL